MQFIDTLQQEGKEIGKEIDRGMIKDTSAAHSNSAAKWIVAGLMVFTTVLSFVFFQHQSLRLDESQSLWQSSHSPAKIVNIVAQDVHIPFYHLILHVWQFIFGSGVVAARLLSLIFFLLSIPALYMLGKTAYNTRMSLFATTIFAISPFMNWYGNEIRMYSLLVLLAILNQYFFVRLFKSEPAENTNALWAGFAFFSLLGIYTHYFFFLILGTEAIFFFLNRKLFPPHALRNFIAICSGLFVAFLPWISYVLLLGQATNEKPSLVLPTSINLFNTFSEFLFGFQTDHLNTILLSLWPLTILLGFMALRRNNRLSPQTFFFILSFIIPNIIAFGVSFIFEPIYLTRYLIFALPPMYLFISWVLTTYPRVLSMTVRSILVIAMLVTLGIESVSAATPVKENYAEATSYISDRASLSDVIVLSSPFTIYPVLYYYKGPLAVETLPEWDRSKFGAIPAFSEADLPKQVDDIKGTHENMWLLISYDQGYQQKILQYMDSHFQQLQKKEFSQGMTLYEYKLRYDASTIKGVTVVPNKKESN